MTIRFRAFPFLVQREIIKSLTFTNLFALSLCSLKTKILIGSILFKNVKSVIYLFSGSILHVLIEEKNNSQSLIGIEGYSNFSQVKSTVTVRIGNFKGRVWFRAQVTEAEECHFINYPNEIEKEIRTGIVDHVNGLFKHCPFIGCEINVDELLYYIPDLGEVDIKVLEGKSVDADFLSFHCSKQSVRTATYIKTSITGTFKNDSTFFEVPNIFCDHPGSMTSTLLHRFIGQHLFLMNVVISSNEVIDALKKWITGEGYQNLETLYLEGEFGLLNRDEILNQLDFKPWDPEKRPKTYIHRKLNAFEALQPKTAKTIWISCE